MAPHEPRTSQRDQSCLTPTSAPPDTSVSTARAPTPTSVPPTIQRRHLLAIPTQRPKHHEPPRRAPPIPILLQDYELSHPGDHRHTDPTYYFHPPSATPRTSEPESRLENPSTLALSTRVDDTWPGQEHAEDPDRSDRPDRLRPAPLISDALSTSGWTSLFCSIITHKRPSAQNSIHCKSGSQNFTNPSGRPFRPALIHFCLPRMPVRASSTLLSLRCFSKIP